MKKSNFLIRTVLITLIVLCPLVSIGKHHAGNYLDSDGCLVVYEYDTAFFGLIKYNRVEYRFCNDDGTALNFDVG